MLLGFTGKDYTIIAASKAAMRGATILKASDDKTRELNKNTLLAFSGEAGDTSMSFISVAVELVLTAVCSTIRRIHTGKHPTLFDAE